MRRLTLHTSTEGERIAFVILDTATSGYVIDDSAFCILATNSDAGINALVIRASSIKGTVGILYALRPTFSIRIATIFRYTIANSVTALGIEPAWRWITWV